MEGQTSSKIAGALRVAAVLVIAFAVFAMAGCGGARRTSSSDKTYLHRVEQGETLEDIADDYYGDPRRAADLGERNNVTDADIEVGMVLRVPLSTNDIDRLRTREEARIPYNEGLDLAEHGSYVDAIQQFKEALDIDPDFVDARYNLGVAYQKIKSYDRARDEFRTVVRKRPTKSEYSFSVISFPPPPRAQ